MGEIWDNVKLGFSLKAIFAVGLILIVLGIVAFVISLISTVLIGFGGIIGIIISVILFGGVFFVLSSFAGNFLSIISVQNISERKIQLGVAFKKSLKRLKNAIIANLIVGILTIFVLVVFVVIGIIIGMIFGIGANSVAGNVMGASDPIVGSLLSGLGGLIVGFFFGYIGLYVLVFGLLPFYSSYNVFIANENLGTKDTLKKAFKMSKNFWPKTLGLVIGTIYAGMIPVGILLGIRLLLTFIHPLLAFVALPIMFVVYVILISIMIHISGRIYVDLKQENNEQIDQPMHASEEPEHNSSVEQKPVSQISSLQSTPQAQRTMIPNQRRMASQRKVQPTHPQPKTVSLTSDEEHDVGKLVGMLKDKAQDYSKEDLVHVMHEKGYSNKVVTEVLKRLRKN